MTTRESSLASNSLLNFALLAVSGVCSIGTTIAVGRSLAPEAVGTVTLASAVATLGGGLLVLGLPTALTRLAAESANDAERRAAFARYALRSAAVGGLIAALAFVATSLLGISLTGSRVGDGLVAIGAGSAAVTAAFGAVVAGLRRFDRLLIVGLVGQPTTLALTVLLAVTYPSATALIGAQALGLLMTATGTCLAGRDLLRTPTNSSHVDAHTPVRRLRPHLAGLGLVDLIVWQRSEVLVLGLVSTRREVAFYGLAYGLVSQAIARLPGALSGVLLPEMAAADRDRRPVLYRSAVTMMAVLLVPIVVLAVSTSADAAEALFGPTFRPVGDIARVVVFGGVAFALGSPAGALLLALDRQRFLLRLGIVCAAFNLALAFFLSRRFGGVGAAAATALVQGVALVAVCRVLHRSENVKWPPAVWQVVFVATVASILSVVAARLIDSPIATIVVTTAIAFVAFASLFIHQFCPRGTCVRCEVEVLRSRRGA